MQLQFHRCIELGDIPVECFVVKDDKVRPIQTRNIALLCCDEPHERSRWFIVFGLLLQEWVTIEDRLCASILLIRMQQIISRSPRSIPPSQRRYSSLDISAVQALIRKKTGLSRSTSSLTLCSQSRVSEPETKASVLIHDLLTKLLNSEYQSRQYWHVIARLKKVQESHRVMEAFRLLSDEKIEDIQNDIDEVESKGNSPRPSFFLISTAENSNEPSRPNRTSISRYHSIHSIETEN